MSKTAGTVKEFHGIRRTCSFYVFEDADLDEAVIGAMANKYRNSGIVCVSANRIYVHETIYDEFSNRLAEKSSQLKVADGRTEGAQIGPLITPQAFKKVEEHVGDAVEKGAKFYGGTNDNSGVQFYKPTVLTDINNNMIYYEETFGPVAPIIKFKDENEVIEMANDTKYGLAGYFIVGILEKYGE